MSANPIPFSTPVQVGTTQFAQAQGHFGELPLRGESPQPIALLELTTPTRTANDMDWEARLAYFPHLHHWAT